MSIACSQCVAMAIASGDLLRLRSLLNRPLGCDLFWMPVTSLDRSIYYINIESVRRVLGDSSQNFYQDDLLSKERDEQQIKNCSKSDQFSAHSPTRSLTFHSNSHLRESTCSHLQIDLSTFEYPGNPPQTAFVVHSLSLLALKQSSPEYLQALCSQGKIDLVK